MIRFNTECIYSTVATEIKISLFCFVHIQMERERFAFIPLVVGYFGGELAGGLMRKYRGNTHVS